MSGSGRGDRGKHRRPFKGRSRDHGQPAFVENRRNAGVEMKVEAQQSLDFNTDKTKRIPSKPSYERPQWTPPQIPTEPMPVPDCPYCGKPIREMAMAIADKNTGQAVHFECIISRISQSENLEHGETISYIGGGRFGIVRYDNPANFQGFTIKKIFEWEIKENRAEWRQSISDHFSVT